MYSQQPVYKYGVPSPVRGFCHLLDKAIMLLKFLVTCSSDSLQKLFRNSDCVTVVVDGINS